MTQEPNIQIDLKEQIIRALERGGAKLSMDGSTIDELQKLITRLTVEAGIDWQNQLKSSQRTKLEDLLSPEETP